MAYNHIPCPALRTSSDPGGRVDLAGVFSCSRATLRSTTPVGGQLDEDDSQADAHHPSAPEARNVVVVRT
jgi:hypothetical protein